MMAIRKGEDMRKEVSERLEEEGEGRKMASLKLRARTPDETAVGG